VKLPEYHVRPQMEAEALRRLRADLSRAMSSGRVLWSASDLHLYSFDATKVSVRPDVVVRAKSAGEVARVLARANDEGIPVYPRGAGTGLSGGAVPTMGGIVLDLAAMDRIVEIDEDNLTVTAQAGVVVAEVQSRAERKGLFYPPDPASNMVSTLGGNIAENAGGLRAFKYGVTRDYVLELEVVLPAGEVLTLGRRTVKGVTGYDVLTLMVGSEGTLGVITQATMKLVPAPKAVATVLLVFRSPGDALDAVSAIVKNRIIPRACEFIDRGCLDLVIGRVELDIPDEARAVLLVETDGSLETAKADLAAAIGVARKCKAFEIIKAEDEAEREKLWALRRELSPAIQGAFPLRINEDICVPRSRVGEILAKVELIGERHGIAVCTYGHAGDGNLHVNVLPGDDGEATMERTGRAIAEIFRETVAAGGTLTGEHGVGFSKQEYLSIEVPEAGIALMRRIKAAFDPNNILNPLKVLPPEGAS